MIDDTSTTRRALSVQRYLIWSMTATSVAITLHLWKVDREYPGDAQSLWIPWVTSLLGLTALGVWFGSQLARAAYLAVLAFVAFSSVRESILAVPFMLAAAKASEPLRRDPGFWWDFAGGLRWIAWWVLNAWFLLRSDAARFFRRR